ncbi:ABC transporter ATP-binding protein [Alkaliphilus hydrothermalis]|uniref:ABC-2 type transport system ATP-binding protein n=1 Tax=Alkaliphilus hydrothermalis TaxID=1482730 RepID=A0ABS2NRV4_9FIRM|nr:ATP-binding cassette domain-containing protein [Alkaliphilus hydrothermalis]MBM7615678.1 ABC-2 type transport system ATP-binding protein [Alkaliphilus hydrothermalis]
MSIISAKNLSKTFQVKTKEQGLKGSLKAMVSPQYKEIQAVKNISLEVARGEVLAFIGPNGAGKSTTIKMLTGILHPTAGEINVLGLNPTTDRRKLSYKIGTVFGQKSQLWFHLPPLDSFNLLGRIYEMEEEEIKKRISYLTELFEIEDLLETPVRKLSLGQRIRCEIAASLLHKPEIIFLDEPTIGLDVVVKQKIRDLIKTLSQESQTTIFLTSHDAGDIEQLCRRAIIINHGQIVLNESVKNLKYNYMNQKVIDIKYAESVTIDHPELKVLKSKGYAVKIEIDSSKCDIDNTISDLMKLGKVVDITISDPPLEEIISGIYQEKDIGGGYLEKA